MRSAVGFGTVLATALATAGLAFVVVPLVPPLLDEAMAPPDEPAETTAPGAEATAEEFWGLALRRECRAASELMWWPADRRARQRGYQQICEGADLPDEVTIGEPSRVGPSRTPYGATDYVVVPVTLGTDGRAPVADQLLLVEVDGEWLVTR